MVLIDFRLRLAPGGGRRKRFGYAFPVDLTCQPNLGIVSGIVGFGAVAGRFAAAAHDRTDGARAQIAEGGELVKDSGAFGFQFAQRVWHEASCSECLITLRIRRR